jgi:hypothetical protein
MRNPTLTSEERLIQLVRTEVAFKVPEVSRIATLLSWRGNR